MRSFPIDMEKEKSNSALCTKNYPVVGRKGTSYLFLWFCPLHGHCYGYHMIPFSHFLVVKTHPPPYTCSKSTLLKSSCTILAASSTSMSETESRVTMEKRGFFMTFFMDIPTNVGQLSGVIV